MTVSLTNVRVLQGGDCGQLRRLAGDRSWKPTRFPATCVYFEHPTHGGCLIDTGYSRHFLTATASLPERFYRWLTPVRLPQPNGSSLDTLAAAGLDPSRVRRLFLSHYHADHIAGLRDFATPRFVCRPAPLAALRKLSRWQKLHHAFLPGLLPENFDNRVEAVEESRFTSSDPLFAPLGLCDYWGDGSLILLDLPGHALGHTGYLLRTETGYIIYVVDACWFMSVLREGRSLPWPSRSLQCDYAAYLATQTILRRVDAWCRERPLASEAGVADSPLAEQLHRTGARMFACHCPLTSEWIRTTTNRPIET